MTRVFKVSGLTDPAG